jgi:hypothetical protein
MLDDATELVARLMAERDEARAEVERLRAELSSARPARVLQSKRKREAEDKFRALLKDIENALGGRRGWKTRAAAMLDIDASTISRALNDPEHWELSPSIARRIEVSAGLRPFYFVNSSKRRHELEDAWSEVPKHRRQAFWRALHKSLTERYAEHDGESPAQMVALREQLREAERAHRAVRNALRTKGRPSATQWLALPTSTQSLVLRRIRHISTDVRRGVEREAAAIAATILGEWLKEEVEQ